MIVYYRLCSIPSTNPSPILQDDKFELNKLCLKSFVRAFKDVNPEVVFLADFCGEREAEMVKQIVPFKHSFIPTAIGINETCLMQYEMALKQIEHEEILFLECDYLWNPAVEVQKLVDAIKELGLVSPYDHPNFYKDRSLHSNKCQIELVSNYHFRSTERNTMTFGLRKAILQDNIDLFNEFGYLDGQVWYDLLERGYPLWTPIKTMATHMVVGNLSPSIDWEAQWKTLL